MTSGDRVPFTILTGFLGAGKTTVLNRLLSASLGRRVAVLVNELGRIDIDSRLILARGGDVLELAGGCVCCKVDVKNDLWDGIADVIRRSRPDHVVLETTGIAEPAAIIDGFARLPEEDRERTRLAGIVCVVDAQAGVRQLERREEALAQVQAADRILLSKLDAAPADSVAELHRRLPELNRGAEIAGFPTDEAATHALGHWLLQERALHTAGDAPHDHLHGGAQISAVAFSDPAPMLTAPLLAVLERLGERLLRAKGFVHVAGEARRGFLEHAGVTTSMTYGAAWGQEPPRTELVIIGEDLDDAAVRRQIWACRAAPSADPARPSSP